MRLAARGAFLCVEAVNPADGEDLASTIVAALCRDGHAATTVVLPAGAGGLPGGVYRDGAVNAILERGVHIVCDRHACAELGAPAPSKSTRGVIRPDRAFFLAPMTKEQAAREGFGDELLETLNLHRHAARETGGFGSALWDMAGTEAAVAIVLAGHDTEAVAAHLAGLATRGPRFL